MQADAVGATTGGTGVAGSLSQQDFLRLLMQQLTAQDPNKPIENAAFVAQMAQFSALAQTQALNDTLGQVLTVSSSSQAISLIGRTVAYTDTSSGQTVSGRVGAVTVNKGIPALSITVGSQTITGISMGQIVSIAPTP